MRKSTAGYLHTVNGNLARFDGLDIREADGRSGFDPKLVADLPTLFKQRRAARNYRLSRGLPGVQFGYRRIVTEAA